jgi:hypothetical protein
VSCSRRYLLCASAPLRLRVENPEHETRSRAVVSCHIRSKSVFHPCQSVARLLLNPPTSRLCHVPDAFGKGVIFTFLATPFEDSGTCHSTARLCHADLILRTEYSALCTSLSPSLAPQIVAAQLCRTLTGNSIASQAPLKCRTILTYITASRFSIANWSSDRRLGHVGTEKL